MKDKISKLKSVLKKYGLVGTLKKIFKYIKNRIGPKVNIFILIKTKIQKNKYMGELNKAINSADRVVVWKSTFGWDVPLYQRPQHIANNLSKNNTVVLYEVTEETDKVVTMKRQHNSLYLVNFNNTLIKKWIMELLQKSEKPKYIQIYSTEWNMTVNELTKYINNGFKIIYEYIDELNPKLAGTKELPINVKEKYEYVMSHKENIYVVVTAEEIERDVINKRGTENLVFASNGVDYNFFKKIDEGFNFDDEFKKILKQEKPIIGYYGAMASWFDYKLIKKLAKARKEYNIVLFGIKYDDTLDKAKLNKYRNIHFMGSRPYNILKNYSNKFTVCTIPFIINSITEATSPVKLFEYMALSKPIVTTNMKECRKYKSVMIANNEEEYIQLIDKAVKISKQPEEYKEYYEELTKEAIQNDWSKKAESIIELVKKYE